MWHLDHKEGKAWKNYLSPSDSKEIKPVNPKGNQPSVFIGRTDAEAETPTFWPPEAKNWLIGKYPDAGRDWGQEEKGTIEDKMVGWHHWLNGLEFEYTLGDSEGLGKLICCSPWGHKESTWLCDWTTTEGTHAITGGLQAWISCLDSKAKSSLYTSAPIKSQRQSFG